MNDVRDSEVRLVNEIVEKEAKLNRTKIELAGLQDVIKEKQEMSQADWRLLRDEETRQKELNERIAHLERQNKMLADREQTLNNQRSYLTEMRLQGA